MEDTILTIGIFSAVTAVLLGVWAFVYFVLIKKATFLTNPKVQNYSIGLMGTLSTALSILGYNVYARRGNHDSWFRDWWIKLFESYPQLEKYYSYAVLISFLFFFITIIIRVLPSKKEAAIPWSKQSKIFIGALLVFFFGFMVIIIVGNT